MPRVRSFPIAPKSARKLKQSETPVNEAIRDVNSQAVVQGAK
jgi:hypothetical protein